MAQLLARATVVVLLAAVAASAAAQDAKPVPTAVWAPKPRQLAPYTAPQRPWIKLAELKTAHRGEPNWRELLVDDGRLMAEYVSAAPGTTVSRRFHPDTREWFAVVEGEVRVEIEGQAPFTATRGSLVNIPRQTLYSLETIGTDAEPALRRQRRARQDGVPAGRRATRRRRRAVNGCRPRSTARPAATTSSTSRT